MSVRTAPTTTRGAWSARRAAPLVVAGGVLLVGAAAAGLRSAGVDVLPACPFHALTGLDCPGCGSTRALLALGRGDVAAALDHHVLFVAAVLPALLIGWVAWVRRAWRDEPVRFRPPSWVVPVAAAVAVGFGVVRNLPGVPFLDAGA